GLLDLVEKHLLAPAQPERERLEVLARGEIHLVRKIVGIESHVFVECLLSALDDLVALRLEHLLELLELDFGHCRGSGAPGGHPKKRSVHQDRNGPSPRQSPQRTAAARPPGQIPARYARIAFTIASASRWRNSSVPKRASPPPVEMNDVSESPVGIRAPARA